MLFHLPQFETTRILVVGDLMLDRYLYGETERISPEAPVPVVKIHKAEHLPGGAGNVALNLKTLGVATTLAGIIGEDDAGELLQQDLKQTGISLLLEKMPEFLTITKQRIISQNQQLLRLDVEDCIPLQLDRFHQRIIEQLSQYQLLILSDYGKGALKDCQVLIQAARQLNIPVLVDPKGSDYSKYQGATLLTPNRKEFEAIVGPCHSDDDFQQKGLALIEKLGLDALLITRSGDGMTLIRKDAPAFHLPAEKREVYDVTGAGDTVISVLAGALAAQSPIEEAVRLANYGAGVVVTKLGAATVTVSELRRAIQSAHIGQQGVVNVDELMIHIEDARAHGETIVFTNGCFDILHAGHITYLEEARQLGDRLIVAVNGDESVRRLKGPHRPMNSLAQRMKVLSALNAVDWVVPFSDDTPMSLIQAIKPDVLVKGGDYQIDTIVGAKEVLSWGGQVKALSFVEGYSTSQLIEKIQEKNI